AAETLKEKTDVPTPNGSGSNSSSSSGGSVNGDGGGNGNSGNNGDNKDKKKQVKDKDKEQGQGQEQESDQNEDKDKREDDDRNQGQDKAKNKKNKKKKMKNKSEGQSALLESQINANEDVDVVPQKTQEGPAKGNGEETLGVISVHCDDVDKMHRNVTDGPHLSMVDNSGITTNTNANANLGQSIKSGQSTRTPVKMLKRPKLTQFPTVYPNFAENSNPLMFSFSPTYFLFY
ncbi:hypothetical protein RFI_05984, partial [Reticulomyxa filosa]